MNYVGEIRLFAGTFAPAGWAVCDGGLLSIADNELLFTLIGTTYGGDGQESFALPNLSNAIAVHVGPNGAMGQTGSAPMGFSTPTVPLRYIIALSGMVPRA